MTICYHMLPTSRQPVRDHASFRMALTVLRAAGSRGNFRWLSMALRHGELICYEWWTRCNTSMWVYVGKTIINDPIFLMVSMTQLW